MRQSAQGVWRPLAVFLLAILVGCGGPIVARTPEALYFLAKEQIAHASYSPAVDSLAKVVREFPQSEQAERAQVLHIALVGGMARAYAEMGDSYLAGSRQQGAAAYASQMRSVAIDYFSRARGRSLEMLEALDRLMRQAETGPLRVDLPFPEVAGAESATLASVRRGSQAKDEDVLRAEREEVLRGLAVLLARAAGAGEDLVRARGIYQGSGAEVDAAAFFLAAAQEIFSLSRIYGPEGLREQRTQRLFLERGAAVAEHAAQLARQKGDRRIQEESERLAARCRESLGKR